jgi:hypothetical protein
MCWTSYEASGPHHRPYSGALRDVERALMQDMHDDLENCLAEGKDPVLLLVVWRDAIRAAEKQR